MFLLITARGGSLHSMVHFHFPVYVFAQFNLAKFTETKTEQTATTSVKALAWHSHTPIYFLM